MSNFSCAKCGAAWIDESWLGYKTECSHTMEEAMSSPKVEPVAWRVQIGDSDVWGYGETESEADFHGKQSGLKYKKQPLYNEAALQAAREEGARLERERKKDPKEYTVTRQYFDNALQAARKEGARKERDAVLEEAAIAVQGVQYRYAAQVIRAMKEKP